MSWNRNTKRTDTPTNPVDQAFKIFEDWAEDHHRSYYGDMVRENLAGYIQAGCSPQEAVNRLVARAPR